MEPLHRLAPAWDAVFATNPAIIEFITGEGFHPEIALVHVIRAFHAAAVSTAAPVHPDMLLAMFQRYPDGALGSRVNSAAFAEDVTAIWRDCIEELHEERVKAAKEINLAKMLLSSTWLSRQLPPVDRLLGDFITTTSRAFLVGETGLGKTMFGLACAMGIGFGTGFLHWRSDRPARVLYIDGEMPAELLIQRLRDAARRIGREDLIDNVMVFSIEDAEDIAERWPMLGMFEPLNTEAGQDFIKRLVSALKPDVIIFDNVQALLVGVPEGRGDLDPGAAAGAVVDQAPHRPPLD